MKKLYFPVANELELSLNEDITIYGKIYAARDAVLPKIVEAIKNDKLDDLNIDLRGSLIFHTAVSSAGIGPTSSNKIDIESAIPYLSAAGVKMHLGKGALQKDTVQALNQHNSYFAITPPVSALLSAKVLSYRPVAFPEEGMEAFFELEVDGIPAIIAIAGGKSIFDRE